MVNECPKRARRLPALRIRDSTRERARRTCRGSRRAHLDRDSLAFVGFFRLVGRVPRVAEVTTAILVAGVIAAIRYVYDPTSTVDAEAVKSGQSPLWPVIAVLVVGTAGIATGVAGVPLGGFASGSALIFRSTLF